MSKKGAFYEFLNPDEVYVPLDDDVDLLITNEQYVYKEQKLGIKAHKIITSPVSGVVRGAKNASLLQGSKQKCIVIANDFKEKVAKKTGLKKFPKTMSGEELTILLQSKNINLDLLKSDTLLISGIDLEESSLTSSYILRDNMAYILETIDYLRDTLNISTTLLVLDNSDTDNISKVSEFLGSYPEISLRLINGQYPAGIEMVLKSQLELDSKAIFLRFNDVLAIYNALIRSKSFSEVYITICGSILEEPVVVNVKIGSLVSAIINQFVKLKTTEPVFFLNFSAGHYEVDISDLIVTKDLATIIIQEKEEIEEGECLNCGLCYKACPFGINPKYIKDNINNEKKLARSKVNQCLKCGVCSILCPANIDLKKYLKGDII